MLEQLIECNVCPHKCKVNRLEGKLGRCKCNDKIKIALVSTHMYEEPCISGTNGSGTIFFSNCNLSCKFCQNYEIMLYFHLVVQKAVTKNFRILYKFLKVSFHL